MSDSFTRAYIECALWSSTDDDGTQLGRLADSDIAPETYAKFEADCAAFQESYAELLAQAGDDAQNGHDFWLTRNGHGAGFWARGYPDAIGDALSEAARRYGSCDLYIGDDGRIYCG